MRKVCTDRAIIWSIIGLVAWAIIGLPVISSFQQSPPRQQNRPPQPTSGQYDQSREEDSKSRTRATAPAQAEAHNQSGHSGDESSDKNWSKIFMDHLPDWFVALFTAVLCVFTALLWWSTNKLWKAGEQQIKMIGENAAEQAIASGYSISTAQKTAEIIANQLSTSLDRDHKAERGLLVTENWALERFQPHTNPLISFSLKNSGRSPSYLVDGKYDFALAAELPKIFDVADQALAGVPGIVRQTTSSEIVVHDLPEIAASDHALVRNGSKFLFLRTTLLYRDVYGTLFEITSTAKWGRVINRHGAEAFGFEFPEVPLSRDKWSSMDAQTFAESRRYNGHKEIPQRPSQAAENSSQ